MTNLEILQKPFTNVRYRKGADGKQVAYVAYYDVQQRIIEATDGVYDWDVTEVRYTEGQTRINRETGETYQTPGTWMVIGRLTLPGLGAKCGVGTAQALNEDGAKSAETDAFKRAAVKFGVGLQLYKKADDSAVNAAATPARQAPPRAGVCNHCRASNGAKGNHHQPGCPNRTEQRASRV